MASRKDPPSLLSTARICEAIVVLRGHKVLLDADLAALYGVTTGRLNEAVKRNLARFPPDFMFQLTNQDLTALRSQFAISTEGPGGRRYSPYAFTEHGAIMAATILNSPRATEISVYVVRAFVQLRQVLATNEELAQRLSELDARIERKLAVHDQALADIITAIRELMAPAEPRSKRPIGFVTGKDT
jgi:hypothetical protein